MKATLTFNLPDEDFEFTSAISGRNYWNVLYGIEQHLRNQYKHGEYTEDVFKYIEEFRDFFYETLTENKVTLD